MHAPDGDDIGTFSNYIDAGTKTEPTLYCDSRRHREIKMLAPAARAGSRTIWEWTKFFFHLVQGLVPAMARVNVHHALPLPIAMPMFALGCSHNHARISFSSVVASFTPFRVAGCLPAFGQS